MIKKTLDGDDVEQELDPNGMRLLEYWRSLRLGLETPRKSDFDPTQIPQALPGIQIVDIVDGPEQFKYRLVGTREVEVRGNDPTGKPVSHGYFGPSAEAVLENYQRAVEENAPVCVVDRFSKANSFPVIDVSLFLPLANGDGTLRHILVYSYQRRPE